MPGNEVGDRVHNFFAQDNLSHGHHHSQALDGNWSVLSNNLWSGSQRQAGLTSSSTKNYNIQQSDTDRGQIGNPLHGSQDLNFTRSFPRPEYAKSQSQRQQPNFNGFMHSNQFYQARQDETNFVAVDTNSDQHNLISRSIPAYGSQQVSSPENQRKSSVRSETSGSPVSFDFFGDQRQMSQQLSMLQSLQHQPSGLNDMQQLQQQVMLMKVQELQRQQQLQQMDARQQCVINQMPPFAKQASGSQPPSLINGSLNSDALNYNSAELGNPNWLQRNGPAMQGSSDGLVFSPNQGKAQRMGDLVPEPVEQSLYGFPISSSRGSLSQNPQMGTEKPTVQLLANFGNSLSGNQHTAFPAQVNAQDRNSIARQRGQAGNSFAHASGHPLSTAIGTENVHQLNMQRNVHMLEFHGRQEQLVPPKTLPAKTETQYIASGDDVALDPTEQRILFGSDDNIWAAFGKSPNGGDGSNLFDGAGFNGFFSIQSGTWSALMQSAVAETSSNDNGMQEEWSGLNFQNIDIPSGNQHALLCNDGRKQQTPLADDNLLMASSFRSGTAPSSGDSNMKKNYQNGLGSQQFGHKFSHETGKKPKANPSQGLDQLSEEGEIWSDGSPVQKSVAGGSQMHGNAYSLDDESSASRQLCNKPNGCKVFGSVAAYGDAVLRVQGSANSMHHYQNNEQKQIIRGEVADGGSLWKSNSHDSRIEKSPLVSAQMNKEGNTVLFDSTTQRTADGSSPFLPNSYQFNYLKNVDQFVKSKVGDAVEGPQNDTNNFSCKEEGKGHELENNDKQENSNDSYRSILSHHTLAGGRKENVVADAIDSRTLSADKQKSSNQMDRKSATLHKFQYHPRGNMDDVEPTHGMKQRMYSQAISHFGQSKFLGQVPKNSIEMGKGQLPDAQRSTKGFDEVHSLGNVPGPIPNISAPFDGFMDMDTPDKASQSSKNMLELLHKVDQSGERAAMMHINAASGTQQAENSDGSVGWLQRSQSSNSQSFGLQLGPPMQRLPVSNQSVSSQSSLQRVSSLHSAHAAPEIGQKGQVHVVTSSFVQSMPPSSERSRGEINRSGIPGQTDNEISVSKMPGNFSSTCNSGFPQLRGNPFGQEIAWAGGQLSRPLEKCGSHSTQKDDPHNRPLAGQSAETSLPDEAGSIPQGGNSVLSGAQKIGTNTGQVLAPQILAGKVVPVSQPSSVSGNSLQGASSKELQSNLAAQHLLGAQFREVSSHFSQSNQTNVANSTSASLNEFDQDGKRGKFQSEFANSQGFHSKEEWLTKASTGEQVSSENINFIQKINGSQGKELKLRTTSDESPAISVSTQRDIEAFGRSLKPNNFLQQNYSLLNQMLVMKNADDDPSNRALKRMKGLDSVGSPTVSPELRQSNDLTAIVGDALVPRKTNSSLDPTMLRFSATENNVASNVSSQHGNIASQGVLAFSRDSSQSSSNAAYSVISPQMASSWFNQYGTLKNGQILPMYDALKAAIVKTGAQPHTLGKSSTTLPTPNSKEPLNAAAVDANGSIWLSATPSLAVEYFSSQILPSNATDQHPVLLRTNDASAKKRKSTTFKLDPWHKEVSQGSRNLQSNSMAEVEWAKSANRRIDKVETEVELLEDGPLMLQQKRRLFLTTQLIQQLFLPPPAAILSMDANMDYESVVYYVSRLALGDACSVVSLTSNKSYMVDDSLNRCSDEIKTSERVHDELLLKVIDDFMARGRKLENEFLRLDKKASVLDLIVECQDLEKFSVINRFAKFHGRGQADSAEAASSADAAANTQKPHPQRYVTALPLPRNFPSSVQCCSL